MNEAKIQKSKTQTRSSRRTAVGAVALLGACGVLSILRHDQNFAVAAPAPAIVAGVPLSADTLRGVTKPSEETVLTFPGPGIVSNVAVKAGDIVKAGQLIASQDDQEEKAKLVVTKAEIDSADLQIKAADADLEHKKVELKRKEELYAELIAAKKSNSEIDEARVDVTIGEVAVAYRHQEKRAKELETNLQQVKLEQKKILSPFDGIVTKIDFHPGEGTDLNRINGIQVVRNDPLWIEVDIPSSKAKVLQVKQPLQVRYLDDEAWMPAEITFLTSYANAGSNTRHVRLEMSNPTRREAGLPVLVKLPENLAAAK